MNEGSLKQNKNNENFKWYYKIYINNNNKEDFFWTPYGIHINDEIEKALKKYKSSQGHYKGKVTLANSLVIDLKENVETDPCAKNRLRQIGRFFYCPSSVLRLNRFSPNFSICKKDFFIFDKDNFSLLPYEKTIIINPNVFPNFKLKTINLPLECSSFKEIEIEKFSDLVERVEKEIKSEANSLDLLNQYSIYRVNLYQNLSPITFFENIIRIYTSEGFLYSRLNEILRQRDFVYLDNLKYTYLSICIAVRYYSKMFGKLRNTFYRGCYLDEKQLESFFYMKTNEDFLYLYEFLSTTYDLAKAKNTIKNSLFIIETGEYHSHVNCAFIEECSEYINEKEVLIGSGTLFQFKSIEQNGDIYIIKLSLITKTVQALSLYLKENKIEKVNLEGNNLVDDDAVILGESLLRNNINLREISFKNNKIGDNGLGYFIKILSDPIGNNIQTSKNKYLYHNFKDLKLDKNNLTNQGITYLCEYVQIYNNLQTISLNSCSIDNLGLEIISKSITKNNSIIKLAINSNKITFDGLKYISDILLSNKVLKKLDISNNSIGDYGILFLTKSLISNQTLIKLNISGNQITDKGAISIGEIIQYTKSLKKLFIGENQLKDNGIKCVFLAMKGNKTITDLTVNDNSFTSKGAYSLFDLKFNENLKKLNLKNNSFKERGAQSLAELLTLNDKKHQKFVNFIASDDSSNRIGLAIKNKSVINQINISKCNIGDLGVKNIAEALTQNNCLLEINLSENSIDFEGAQSLSEALKNNSSLLDINLGRNFLGSKGVQVLVDSLVNNKTLKKLNLKSNNIGEQGAKHISTLLINNKTLTSLNLGMNNISQEGGKVITEGIHKNYSLLSLNLRNNKIDEKDMKIIQDSLDHNMDLTSRRYH